MVTKNTRIVIDVPGYRNTMVHCSRQAADGVFDKTMALNGSTRYPKRGKNTAVVEGLRKAAQRLPDHFTEQSLSVLLAG